ncbi:MAG: flagellar protein export ATPase FliI [Gammaproteobacteria bacterium]|nr:flagellar protein export ATPase FliI [Gammaproteobacteria bacterium]
MSPLQSTESRQQHWGFVLQKVRARVQQANTVVHSGRVVRATGMVLEVVGLELPVGSACRVEVSQAQAQEPVYCEAEVVGFAGERSFLMPLEEIHGLTPGARVLPLQSCGQFEGRRYPMGRGLLGRVVDGTGQPLDNKGAIQNSKFAPLTAKTLNPMLRAPIEDSIDVGIRTINALLTVGRGQRMGLFAGSGVGKSMLLGMMARFTTADVIVVGLIGERGREVQDFINNILGAEGLQRAVVVAAPADTSPLQRLQGASYATRIAEDFRDQGLNVLLIMDSLTRYAMAQREIALAIGEPPATKGYPPSVFAKLPALVERAGNGPQGGGSITAFYTVLTEGDDQQDPIADSARAILDGHIVLSRNLAESGHYPAIDVEASISRVMTSVVPLVQVQQAQKFKKLFSTYQRNRDLISVGAYSPGHDPVLDQAVNLYPRMEAFLQQQHTEGADQVSSLDALSHVIGGLPS